MHVHYTIFLFTVLFETISIVIKDGIGIGMTALWAGFSSLLMRRSEKRTHGIARLFPTIEGKASFRKSINQLSAVVRFTSCQSINSLKCRVKLMYFPRGIGNLATHYFRLVFRELFSKIVSLVEHKNCHQSKHTSFVIRGTI